MQKIPILDLKRQIKPIRKELDAAIKRVVDSAHFILGEEIADFEHAVEKYCRIKYAVAVSNGTDAIKLSLLSLGIQPGEGVICPAFTYYATAGAIVSMGAVPVFADIDPDTYNISVSGAEAVIRQRKSLKIKAILPVHLYGQCADMEAIAMLAGKYRLKIIEDTAQAFGAEYKGRKAGTMADCAAVSFFPGKNLGAFGDAGMILTDNQPVAEKLRLLRNQGNKEKYYHSLLGYNHRMDALQAAILKVKLKYLDSWNKKRQANAAYFNRAFRGLNIRTPYVAEGARHIYHQYVLRVSHSSAKLIEHLKNKGIDARVYYPLALHLQPCFKYLGYKRGDFSESERASQEVLAIPVYPDLTQKEMDYIIEAVKEFLP